jgi:ABC-type branched-subunit amino acid transport system substrate-binding protein
MKQYPNGIDGHQIEYDVQNDQGNTTVAANVAKQFIDDHVTAVLEPSEDPGAQALQMQIWQKAKLPVIGFDFGDTTYTNTSAYPYVFSVLTSAQELGQAGATWMAQHPQYKRIAVLSDSTTPEQQWADGILTPLKSLEPAASVVATATMDLGAVDVSAQVAKLKASNPDIVLIAVGFGFGPVWNAFQAQHWAPPILSTQNAFYDGYKSLGSLATTAVAPANDCLPSATTAIPSQVTDLMNAYVQSLGNISVNMLIFVNTDSMVLEFANYAVTTNHSTAPDAIKNALENLHQSLIGGFFQYQMSQTNHFGLTGDLASHVCRLSPLVGGPFSIPTAAQ